MPISRDEVRAEKNTDNLVSQLDRMGNIIQFGGDVVNDITNFTDRMVGSDRAEANQLSEVEKPHGQSIVDRLTAGLSALEAQLADVKRQKERLQALLEGD